VTAPTISANSANFSFSGEPDGPILRGASSRSKSSPDVTIVPKSKKERLDLLVVARGLAESRQKAHAMILAGEVTVSGQRADKPGTLFPQDALIEVTTTLTRYVGRGGFKLEGALEDFGVVPDGKICLDAGSSTGGFTDCLLQRGADRVYAVDVTTSQLAWKVRQDSRVVPIETNIRYLDPKALADRPSLVTVDVSFISVGKVLPRLVSLAAPGAEFLILVKPQFELERGDVGKGGIVRDPQLHKQAIERVRKAADSLGLLVKGVHASRLPGTEGNQEFFLYASLGEPNSGAAGNAVR
jgi:23S rRNA (cytidine1920-2'-O)/16S rRNA (cytidine1409-2'-O)-methyltransferase